VLSRSSLVFVAGVSRPFKREFQIPFELGSAPESREVYFSWTIVGNGTQEDPVQVAEEFFADEFGSL
jgi:hypothetical protein